MMLALRYRALSPVASITEAHPKALLIAQGVDADDGQAIAQHYGLKGTAPTEHLRDAVLAAVAAREGNTRRWTLDLANDRDSSELDPKAYWLAPIHYWWPD